MLLKRWLLRSLKVRLLLPSFLLMPLVIGMTGYALQTHYQSILENGLEARMRMQVYLMMGGVDAREHGVDVLLPPLLLSRASPAARFLLHDGEGLLLWQSDPGAASAGFQHYFSDLPQLPAGETRFIYLQSEHTYLYQYPVIWDRGQQRSQRLVFTVLESDSTLQAAMMHYCIQLWGWLCVVTVLLLMLQMVITRWGLRPLAGLVKDLLSLEKGFSSRLTGHYPEEVRGVTDSLNHLLHSERNQRERYRNTLGDLAHSLKTPLAVIRGASSEDLSCEGYKSVVEEQVRRMDQIVQYQLARAVRSKNDNITHATPIAPLIKRIASALTKVYREKGVEAQLVLDESVLFGSDERDMMELMGNLLENAFKYGHSQVKVSLLREVDVIRLDIEDDGPGVSPDMRHVILQRGARVDTSAAPGQGIGLTVAVDILSSYNGQLEVGESPMGGARFRIMLPIG